MTIHSPFNRNGRVDTNRADINKVSDHSLTRSNEKRARKLKNGCGNLVDIFPVYRNHNLCKQVAYS